MDKGTENREQPWKAWIDGEINAREQAEASQTTEKCQDKINDYVDNMKKDGEKMGLPKGGMQQFDENATYYTPGGGNKAG